MIPDDSSNPNRTRFRVRLGSAEIEYEGEAEFLTKEVMPAVAKILKLAESRAELINPEPADIGDPRILQHRSHLSSAPLEAQHTTGSLATLFEAKSASDLIMAAAAYLTFVARKETFDRNELIEAMRSATAFYKKSDSSNLSKTLRALVKTGRLRESASDTYVVPAKVREEMEHRIAQAD